MTSQAKAPSARSTSGRGNGLGFVRRAFATRGACSDAKESGAPSHRLRSTLLAAPFAFAIVFTLALLIAPAAQAALPEHPFLGVFCEGEPNGVGTPACQPEFGSAQSIAVDQSTGDVLVVDKSAGTISRYHEDGTPANFSALGTNVIDGKGSGGGPGATGTHPCTPASVECDETPANELAFFTTEEVEIAVDSSGGPTNGDIYVAQVGENLIDIFSAGGEYLGALNEFKEGPTAAGPLKSFGYTCGVAVGPDGDVYIGDYEHGVHKFDPAAHNPPVNADNTANFTDPEACQIAVGAGPSAGSIFVARYGGEVTRFDATSGAEEYVVSPGSNTTVSVDPVSGHVYAATGSEVKEFDAAGASAVEISAISTAGKVEGVAVNGTSGHEASGYVYVSSAGEANVEVYGPLPPQNHPFLGVFCEGEPNGVGTPACQPEFGSAQSIAVDQSTGDVLVVDKSAGTISRYHEDGTPANFSALGTNVIDGKGSGGGPGATGTHPCTPASVECDETPANELAFFTTEEVEIAVDSSGGPTNGDIYVAQVGENLIDIFSAGGEYLGALNEFKEGPTAAGPLKSFGYTCGVAVGPDGDVYIGDYEHGVHKFDPAAHNPPVNADNTANFTDPEACQIAVGAGPSAGSIFVARYGGEVTRFDATSGAEEYVVSPGSNTTVSVDPVSGHVYAATGSEVKEFDAAGASAVEISAISTAGKVEGVAVNGTSGHEASGYVYVSSAGEANVEVYGPLESSTGFKLKLIKEGTGTGSVECKFDGSAGPCIGTHPEGASVEVIATANSGSVLTSLSGAGSASGCTASPCTFTLAADATLTARFDLTPPSVENDPPGTVTSTTAVLNGHVDNEGAPAGSVCKFEVTLAEDEEFEEPVATLPCVPSPVTGSANTAVSATVTGLNPVTDYIYRVVATNSGGTSEAAPPEPFATPTGPPLISEERASAVTKTTATLNADVNPSGLPTTYHFEWGLGGTAPYEHRIPAEGELPAGSGNTPLTVHADLTGLEPGTTYHFRLVATNSVDTTKGPDEELVTANGFDLPDNRGYELVSPADKRPVGFVSRFLALQLQFQAADDGQSIVYPIMNGLADVTAGGEVRYLASRGDDSWSSTQVSAPSLRPVTQDTTAGPSSVRFYSPDLSCGVLESSNPLSEEVSQTDREYGVDNLYRRNSDGSFTLITNVTPDNPELHGNAFYTVAGATSDCGRVFFQSNLQGQVDRYRLIPGASSLYEWDHGTLRDAAILPNGATPVGKVGPGSNIEYEAGHGEEVGTRFNSVSSHGRLFFTATSDEGGDSGHRAVFVRNGPATASGSGDLSSSTTVSNLVAASGTFAVGQTLTGAGIPAGTRIVALGASTATLSKPATATATGVQLKATEVLDVSLKQGGTKDSAYAHYEIASADGSHVFFLDNYGLTPSSSSGATQCTSSNGETLPSGCDLYDFDVETGALQDLSANANPANPTGASVAGVVDASADGSYVYFAARGRLISGQGNTYAQNASAHAANVYLSHNGTLSYVATVRKDDLDGTNGVAGVEGNSGMLINVPSGWDANATPDGRHLLFVSKANLTGYDSGGAKEAYRYAADSNTTVCLSCRPDGLHSIAAPFKETPVPSTDAQLDRALHFPRAISDDGSRIFFTMPDVLAPGAIAGKPNLYEWEKGQVHLLAAGGGVKFEDSSQSGKDVFLTTTSQLDPHDFDFNWDLYDVRVDGGFPPPPTPPTPCDPTAGQCQGTSAVPPAAPSAASEGVAGPGNPPAPRPCKKGEVRKHGKCVAKHHRKKHHKRRTGAKHRAANVNPGGAR